MFIRELLDAWVYDVCGAGTPFRNAFSSWMPTCTSESAAFNLVGYVPTVNRQHANEAFNLLSKTLHFPEDDVKKVLLVLNAK